MNREKQKIEKLWRHLKIQDEHLLVRVTDRKDHTEKVLTISEDGNGGLVSAYVKLPPEGFAKWLREYKQPFTLVQERDESGCFIIPDIDRWKEDEEADY